MSYTALTQQTGNRNSFTAQLSANIMSIGNFYFMKNQRLPAQPQLWASCWPYPSAVPPGVKDVFVWLTETPAPSDFLVCYTNALTYLLTYLLKSREVNRHTTQHASDALCTHGFVLRLVFS